MGTPVTLGTPVSAPVTVFSGARASPYPGPTCSAFSVGTRACETGLQQDRLHTATRGVPETGPHLHTCSEPTLSRGHVG